MIDQTPTKVRIGLKSSARRRGTYAAGQPATKGPAASQLSMKARKSAAVDGRWGVAPTQNSLYNPLTSDQRVMEGSLDQSIQQIDSIKEENSVMFNNMKMKVA